MKRYLAAIAVCLAAGAGCRMCSDCCDTSPPVADSPYHNPYGRAGSAFTGPTGYSTTPLPAVEMQAPVGDPTVAAPADSAEALTASALGWSE